MDYAVVIFEEENSVHVVPSSWIFEDDTDDQNTWCWWPPENCKNILSLIKKKVEPTQSTWQRLTIKVKHVCGTYKKAATLIPNSIYSSEDEKFCGKGHRVKIPNKHYKEDSTSDEENNNLRKSVTSKLPPPLNGTSSNENNTDKINSTVKCIEPIIMEEQTWQEYILPVLQHKNVSAPLQTEDNPSYVDNCGNEQNEDHRNVHDLQTTNDIPNSIYESNRRIEVNIQAVLRVLVALELKIDSLAQRLNKISPIVQINAPTDNVRGRLPLKTIEDINAMETALKVESFTNEYKAFVQKIGGHNPKEYTQRALSRVFTNMCAKECSWKGRGDNFRVDNLLIIKLIKDVVTATYISFRECDFDDVAAEWFRFANQRHKREKV